MLPLPSRVDPRSDTFRANRAAMEEALATLAADLGRAREGGGDKANRRHVERGRLLPRDRIAHLLDRGSPWLELCALAGMDIDGGKPGAGLVAGIGRVSGVECLVTASEATVQGGAVSAWGVKKNTRLAEIALENRLPW